MRTKVVFIVVGAIILFLGLVWFLQGVNVLPGSVMTGSQFWAAAGGFAAIVGLILIAAGVYPKKRE